MAGAPLPKLWVRLEKPRLAAYVRNLRFYEGEQWPAQRQASSARRLTLNYARTLIDKVTSYVTADVRLEVRPPAVTGQPTEAQLAAARGGGRRPAGAGQPTEAQLAADWHRDPTFAGTASGRRHDHWNSAA